MAKKQDAVKTFVALTSIKHDGEKFAKGETIELTQDQASPLLEVGSIKPFLAPTNPPEDPAPVTPPLTTPPAQ